MNKQEVLELAAEFQAGDYARVAIDELRAYLTDNFPTQLTAETQVPGATFHGLAMKLLDEYRALLASQKLNAMVAEEAVDEGTE